MSDARLSKLKGDFAEKYVAFNLISRGLQVFENLTLGNTDLVCINNHGHMYRLQVKSSVKYKSGSYCFGIKEKRSRKHFKNVDYLICVGLDKEDLKANHIWIIYYPLLKDKKANLINITSNSKYNKFKDDYKELMRAY